MLLDEEILAPRAEGTAGGPIEVLMAPTLGLGGFVVVIEGALVLDGVPVRELVADVVADESCFVGDFAVDCIYI